MDPDTQCKLHLSWSFSIVLEINLFVKLLSELSLNDYSKIFKYYIFEI